MKVYSIGIVVRSANPPPSVEPTNALCQQTLSRKCTLAKYTVKPPISPLGVYSFKLPLGGLFEGFSFVFQFSTPQSVARYHKIDLQGIVNDQL